MAYFISKSESFCQYIYQSMVINVNVSMKSVNFQICNKCLQFCVEFDFFIQMYFVDYISRGRQSPSRMRRCFSDSGTFLYRDPGWLTQRNLLCCWQYHTTHTFSIADEIFGYFQDSM